LTNQKIHLNNLDKANRLNVAVEELHEYLEFLKKKEQNQKEGFKNDSGKIEPSKLADILQKDFVFKTTTDSDEIYYYNDGIYIENGEHLIKTKCEEITESETTSHITNEALFHVRARTYTDRELFNGKPKLIHLENGIYDLDKKEVMPFSEDIIATYKLPIEFKAEADCPLFKKFLSEILNEQDKAIIQELIGYCLWKDYEQQKAFMLLGEGSNGKSTLLEVIRTMLGSKNVSSIALQDFDRSSFALVQLFGKMANIYPDLTDRALRETGKFKMLTGGDEIEAEIKFQQKRIRFKNYAKMIFSCNKIPEAYDETEAYFRRWVIINFPHKFDDKTADKDLTKKLTSKEEISGIFNWAIEGLKRLQEQQKFSYNKTVEEIKEQYTRLANSFQAFVNDCCVQDIDRQISKRMFYKEYEDYCKKFNLPLKKENIIGKDMKRICPNVESKRVKIDLTSREWFWVNIRVKSESELKENQEEIRESEGLDIETNFVE
jgi:putative DNA primase/helicase